jgi:hypothetical protein
MITIRWSVKIILYLKSHPESIFRVFEIDLFKISRIKITQDTGKLPVFVMLVSQVKIGLVAKVMAAFFDLHCVQKITILRFGYIEEQMFQFDKHSLTGSGEPDGKLRVTKVGPGNQSHISMEF